MQNSYFVPDAALRKLRAARSLSRTAYVYGMTGFGKTTLVREYLSKRRYEAYMCSGAPWGDITENEPGRPRTVFIDDLHRLRDVEQRQMVAELVRAPDIWLVLAGRCPVPQWLMPCYVSEGFIVIGEDDLRLTEKEITAYLDSCGVSCTKEQLQLLCQSSIGNAYVVNHAVRRMQEGAVPGPELQQEIRGAFMHYLENVVMPDWDSDLLEFLMKISAADEFTVGLAEMVTADSNAVELIERAMEAGNFLSQEGGVYHLSPVLLDALRRRAERVFGRERMHELACNTGLYYEMNGNLLAALRMYERSGSSGRTRDLLIRNARLNPGNGHYFELREYYFQMDEAEIEKSPVLMAGMSMLHSLLLDVQQSELWYDRLKEFARNAKGGEKREAQSRLAYLEIALPHRGSADMKEIMLGIPGLLLDKGISLPEFSVTSNLPSTMNGGKDFCHWSKSDVALAKSIGPLVERILGRYGKGLVKAALGESFYEKGGDSYQVMSLLSRAQMETERGGLPEIAFAAVGLRVRLSMVQGDAAGAEELLDSFETAVREKKAVQLLPNLNALRCRIALYKGEAGAASRWMECAPDEDKEFFVLERYRYLTKVRCLLVSGEPLRAAPLIERLLEYAEICQRPYVRMETGLLKAVVQERMGLDWRGALLAVLDEAADYGFLRVVSEEGMAVWHLLEKLKKEGALARFPEEWMKRVLDETAAMREKYPLYLQKRSGLAAEFCETAVEVLRLQSDGLSTTQIARRLGAKPDTVKYHIKENYRKLGASCKAEALQAAKSLGLI